MEAIASSNPQKRAEFNKIPVELFPEFVRKKLRIALQNNPQSQVVYFM